MPRKNEVATTVRPVPNLKESLIILPPDIIKNFILKHVDLVGSIEDWNSLRATNTTLLHLCKEFRIRTITYPRGETNPANMLKVDYFFFRGNYYLEVPPDTNYSTYKIPSRGGWTPQDSDVKTIWYRIRVDPESLMVNNGDFTFSRSTGYCGHHSNNTTSVPYGTAFGCESPNYADGTAKIDLSKTVFYVESTFKHEGWMSAGDSNFNPKKQIVDIKGGGYCGWMCPKDVPNESEAAGGGWYIRLGILYGK
jgi:hypothetical protein